MPENPQPSFEDALTELETLVDTLDQGEMPLDESLMRFGNGLITARAAQSIAAQAARIAAVPTTTLISDENELLANQNE